MAKKIFLWIWQLPQNLLGLIVRLFVGGKKTDDGYYTTRFNMGVSLGNYIIVKEGASQDTIKHEKGHQWQSGWLGPLYLIVIGIPSFLFNIFDRIFHKKWPVDKRMKWYYSLPWEANADRLGGVTRKF